MMWLLSNSWARTALLFAVSVLGFVLFAFGQRKAGERVGAMKVKLENANAAKKAQDAMASVPRPDKPDVVAKLRDKKF